MRARHTAWDSLFKKWTEADANQRKNLMREAGVPACTARKVWKHGLQTLALVGVDSFLNSSDTVLDALMRHEEELHV